jgi:hypothetical protein
MRLRPILSLILLTLVSLGTSRLILGQSQEGVPKLPDSVRNSPNTTGVPTVDNDEIQKQQAAAAAQMRIDQIKRDSEKLFQLSAELKDQVDKTNGQILSVDAIKKADEIEKLAKSLKGKMKLSY